MGTIDTLLHLGVAIGAGYGAHKLSQAGHKELVSIGAGTLVLGGIVSRMIDPKDANEIMLTAGLSAASMRVGQAISDHLMVAKEQSKHPCLTGTVAPSTPFVARALTQPLRERAMASPAPLRVLEIGAGTGPITEDIVDLLRPGDTLDLIEINNEFAQRLKQRFREEPDFVRVAHQAKIHVVPLGWYEDAPYDIIISTLPHSNFSEALIKDTYNSYFRLLKPGGTLTYIEYLMGRPARKIVASKAEKARFDAVSRIVDGYAQRFGCKRERVVLNVPPTAIQHLCRPGA